MRALAIATLLAACAAPPEPSCHVETGEDGKVVLSCPGSAPLTIAPAACSAVKGAGGPVLRCAGQPDQPLPAGDCRLDGGSLVCGGESLPLSRSGELTGRVSLRFGTDTTSAVVGVAGTGIQVRPDATGAFRIPGLLRGTYELTVSAPGFSRRSFGPVALPAGASLDVGTLGIERLRVLVDRLTGNAPVAPGNRLLLPGNGLLDPVTETVTWYDDQVALLRALDPWHPLWDGEAVIDQESGRRTLVPLPPFNAWAQLTYSLDGRTVAVQRVDGRRLWVDAPTGDMDWFSPSVQMVVPAATGFLAVGSGTVELIPGAAGSEREILSGAPTTFPTVSPDQRFLAAYGNIIDTSTLEMTDVGDGQVVFSPDGQKAAIIRTGQGTSDVFFWSRGGGEPVDLGTNQGWPVWTDDSRALVFTRSSSSVLLYTVEDGGQRSIFATGDIFNMTFSPDGRYLGLLVSGPEGSRILVTDIVNGGEVAFGKNVTSWTLIFAGQRMIFADPDGTSIFDLDTRKAKRVTSDPFALVPQPGNRLIVSQSKGLTVWDVASGEQVLALPSILGWFPTVDGLGLLLLQPSGTYLWHRDWGPEPRQLDDASVAYTVAPVQVPGKIILFGCIDGPFPCSVRAADVP